MYTSVLTAHSWLRWVALALGVLAIARAFTGSAAKRPWGPADDRVSAVFLASVDLQLLIGLLLYFLWSPITTEALQDYVAAMRSSGLRFWAVEHPFGMLAGVVLAHVGRVRVRRGADPVRKHRTAAVFYTLALVAMAASIPWPGTPNGRPLWRW